jgi:ABC-type uncharacterized transport system substrate-binding protein
VIAATAIPAALAAKAVTTTIPIVFETGADPIQFGLVASLNRPGGHVTGVTQTNAEIAPKPMELQASGLVIAGDPFFTARQEQLAALALRYKVPAVYQGREFAVAGGLMSYGGSTTEAYRLAGVHAARILKGEKPSELPGEQSMKVELFLNLKTAKALGITFPLTLLGRADDDRVSPFAMHQSMAAN